MDRFLYHPSASMINIYFVCFILIAKSLAQQFPMENAVYLADDDYEIQNRGDDESGFLTVVHDSKLGLDLIYVKLWNNTDSQNWKAKHHRLSPKHSVEFIPKSHSNTALDVDLQKSLVFTEAGVHNIKRTWIIKDVGLGYFAIINMKVYTCLTSNGLDNPVKLAECENTRYQQWKFKQLEQL